MKPPRARGGNPMGGGGRIRKARLLNDPFTPIRVDLQDPEELAALRNQIWWRVCVRRRALPEEIAVLVIDGGRDD